MNITLVAIAIVVIIVGVVSSRGSLINQTEEIVEEKKEEVLSEETESPTPSPQSGTGEQATPTATSIPMPSPSSDPSNETMEQPNNANYSDWIYPNSNIISQENVLVMTSSDSTDAIHDWYRNKINSGGYNVRNSVKTSANDVVKNVINAVNDDSSVNVEITKDGGSTARIEVTLSSL